MVKYYYFNHLRVFIIAKGYNEAVELIIKSFSGYPKTIDGFKKDYSMQELSPKHEITRNSDGVKKPIENLIKYYEKVFNIPFYFFEEKIKIEG